MDNPVLYKKMNGIQIKGYKLVLEEYMDKMNVSNGEKILDIGCGPGDSTCLLLEKALPEDVQIVGSDISKEMISYASKAYGKGKRRFKEGDISDPEIANVLGKDYDKVFSFFCLHWIRDQKACLKNIQQLLKPSGRALLCIPVKHICFAAYSELAKRPQWEPYMKDRYGISPYFDVKDPKEYFKKIMNDLNLKIVTCDLKEISYWHTTMNELHEMLESVNPFKSRLPPEMLDKYKEDRVLFVQENMKEESDGRVQCNYTILVAVVQKE